MVIQVVVPQEDLMEKVKQDIQVAKAVTLDQDHIQDLAEAAEAPL